MIENHFDCRYSREMRYHESALTMSRARNQVPAGEYCRPVRKVLVGEHHYGTNPNGTAVDRESVSIPESQRSVLSSNTTVAQFRQCSVWR